MKVNVVTDRVYLPYYADKKEIEALKDFNYKFGYQTTVTINDFKFGNFVSVIVDVDNIYQLVKLLKIIKNEEELLYYKVLTHDI